MGKTLQDVISEWIVRFSNREIGRFFPTLFFIYLFLESRMLLYIATDSKVVWNSTLKLKNIYIYCMKEFHLDYRAKGPKS